jgi:hypothetical protein
MECAELYAATTGQRDSVWDGLSSALQVCPYAALVEFNTHHGRPLLTLAERSLETGLAAAAAAAGGGAGSSSGGSSSSSRDRSRGAADAGAADAPPPLHVAVELAGCVVACMNGGNQGGVSAVGTQALEAKGETCVVFGCRCKAMPPNRARRCRVLS